MPRWIERRGFTLRLREGQPDARPDARHQVVRLSLVERRGLTGRWFNVREARAESNSPDAEDQASLRLEAGGRTLGWRWLRQREAERLLDQRLRTLEALGYAVTDAAVASRGRWDWLYDLVRRGLAPAREQTSPRHQALHDALQSLGLSPDAIVEGVAAVLKLSPEQLRHPDGRVVAAVDREQLGVLLPFLVEHQTEQVRQIGERWIHCPGAAFALPRPTVERWLAEAGRVGELLAPRVRDHGLALLGPDALLRLSRSSTRASVRQAAEHWLGRLP